MLNLTVPAGCFAAIGDSIIFVKRHTTGRLLLGIDAPEHQLVLRFDEHGNLLNGKRHVLEIGPARSPVSGMLMTLSCGHRIPVTGTVLLGDKVGCAECVGLASKLAKRIKALAAAVEQTDSLQTA